MFLKDGIPTIKIESDNQFLGYRIIDVRSEEEFNGKLGHIKGAQLITLGEKLDQFFQNESDKNQKIIFVCRSGVRSASATNQAQQAGFKNVFNLEGGMLARQFCLVKNIHPIERIIRILLGLTLISFCFIGPKSYWFLLGIIPLVTGIIGHCPPYKLLGISTLKKSE